MKDSIPSTFTANLLEPQGHRFEGYFPPGAVAYAQSGDNLRTSAGPGKDLEQIWRVWDGDGWKEDGKSATGWCSRLILGWFCGMFLELIGGLEHFLFFDILGISSQLTFIFFRGVGIPPTSIDPTAVRKITHDPQGFDLMKL